MLNIQDYLKGIHDGRKQILMEIVQIVKSNTYPEYVQDELVEYLESKGIKL